MKKILLCLLFGITFIAFVSISTVYADEVITENNTSAISATHTIAISTGDDDLSVGESIKIQESISNETYETITFWIPSEAKDISISVNYNAVTYIPSDNEYLCNITDLAIAKNTSMQVTLLYTLPKNSEEFQKTVMHDTTSLIVTFNDNLLYGGQNLVAEGSFALRLYKPTEAPLSWYIIVFIVLLVVLLIVSMLYSFRKQKSSTTKEMGSESEELLTTRKALLMSLLKDIEKQHRAKQISDDTYHKLKEHYKQQAVVTMKKLEDIK